MSRRLHFLLPVALLPALGVAPAAGQTLHLNDRWKDCAFVISPELTQGAWHQFVGEVGSVLYLRPMTPAKPLGAGKIEFAILQAATAIDDHDDAWNHTFSHPHEEHVLVEGSALQVPGLTLRAGLTDRIDVGVYATKSLGANYGLVGGQLQYSIPNVSGTLDAAARITAVHLVGPDDLSASVHGVDFVVSRDVWKVSPYAGVSGYLARGQEHTSKVDLHDENVLGAQAMIGVSARISALRLGAEINTSRVQGYALKIGFGI